MRSISFISKTSIIFIFQNPLQRYKKSAILARKICDFAQNNLRFYIKSSIQHNKSCPVIGSKGHGHKKNDTCK